VAEVIIVVIEMHLKL